MIAPSRSKLPNPGGLLTGSARSAAGWGAVGLPATFSLSSSSRSATSSRAGELVGDGSGTASTSQGFSFLSSSGEGEPGMLVVLVEGVELWSVRREGRGWAEDDVGGVAATTELGRCLDDLPTRKLSAWPVSDRDGPYHATERTCPG